MWDHTHIFPFRRQLQFQHRRTVLLAPSITAFIPEAYFIYGGTSELDKPAYNAACLAGACPTPA
jgi:hypothetical protein